MSSLYGGNGYSPSGSIPANTATGNYGKPWKEKVPSGYRKSQIQQFTPEQMQLFDQGFGRVSQDSYLSRLAGGDEAAFNQMEAPALKQFNALQGNLASRFSGMGNGARNSSGFQNASNQAAMDFASQLQSNRLNLQQQALRDLHSMSQEMLNQRPFEVGLQEKRQGFDWGGLLGGLAGGAAGFFAGGPSGALTGAQMGNSAFGRVGSPMGSFQSSSGWVPSWNGRGGNMGNQNLLNMPRGV